MVVGLGKALKEQAILKFDETLWDKQYAKYGVTYGAAYMLVTGYAPFLRKDSGDAPKMMTYRKSGKHFPIFNVFNLQKTYGPFIAFALKTFAGGNRQRIKTYGGALALKFSSYTAWTTNKGLVLTDDPGTRFSIVENEDIFD